MCSCPRKFTFKEVEFPKQNSSEFVAYAYSKDGSSDQEWRSKSVNQELHRGSSIGTYGYKLPACSVVSRRYRSWCAAYCSSDERSSMPAGNLARAPRNDLSRSRDRSGCYARPGALYVAWNLKRCIDASQWCIEKFRNNSKTKLTTRLIWHDRQNAPKRKRTNGARQLVRHCQTTFYQQEFTGNFRSRIYDYE